MNRLKELRKEKNWTQIQIQHYFNIDQSEYSKMERGLRDPTMAQAIEFADFYKTSLDFLMCRTNEKKPYPPI